jgi:hypothetical protein
MATRRLHGHYPHNISAIARPSHDRLPKIAAGLPDSAHLPKKQQSVSKSCAARPCQRSIATPPATSAAPEFVHVVQIVAASPLPQPRLPAVTRIKCLRGEQSAMACADRGWRRCGETSGDLNARPEERPGMERANVGFASLSEADFLVERQIAFGFGIEHDTGGLGMCPCLFFNGIH